MLSANLRCSSRQSTSSGPKQPRPEVAHTTLWKLIVAATERAEATNWRVDHEILDAEFWRSLGIARRPAFVLQIPVHHDWEQPELPMVTAPPQLEGTPTQTMHGQVLGPRDIPMARARVEIRSLGMSCTCDMDGRFRFGAVPTGAHRPSELLVRAKGRSVHVPIPASSGEDPILVSFQIAEA